MAAVGILFIVLPMTWACTPQKADYIMVSCFPNAIIANVPECPYGWEIGQLSLGSVCYSGINTPGFYRFTIPDLTPKNHSYCGTLSENSKFLYAKDAPYVIDTSEIGSEVFIGIEAKGLSNRFKVVITNCWATPTPYSTDKKRWTLIQKSCSLDNTVIIFENAKDSRSMFKFNSFRFQRLEKVSTVWLHCEVQTPCTSRSTEFESDPNGGILTMEFKVRAQHSSSYIHPAGPFLCLLSIFLLNEVLGYFSW
ncbi:hypothetical protein cypCar_00046491 [Cyprinus carpio]|nr:hypothetical protein cypCar_00046491 [Cyprinus carpio]